MKRFFNFRPLLLIFLTAIFSIYSVIKIFLGNFTFAIILFLVLLFFVAIFVVSLFKENIFSKFFKFFGVKSAKIFCLLVIISSMIFSGMSAICFANNVKREFDNTTQSINAYVKEVVNYENTSKILLSDIQINGKRYDFKIQLSTSGNFYVGERLSFSAKLFGTKLVKNGAIDTSVVKLNLKYYASCEFENIIKTDGKAKILDKVKDDSKHILSNNLSEENAGFAYAVLFGDKTLLSNEYYNIFKSAGLAHILAVSGLHISFLIALLSFILKKLKIKKKVQFFVILAILIVYNIICNFSPSVFRASVMSLCLMLGLILGERNDGLSNLGLAGIIVLTFFPLLLFDVGFLLSFGSVFGIFLFEREFSKLFDKLKFPKFLSSSLSVTFSATLGTLPWICKYFKYFAPISFLSNLIVLPLFSISFVILLISVLINLIVSFPIAMFVTEFFVNIVVSFSNFFARFGTMGTISFDTLSAIIYYVVCVLISPFFIMNTKSKLLCVMSGVLCFTTILSYCNTQKIDKNNLVLTTSNINQSLFYKTHSGLNILCNIETSKYGTNNQKNILTEYNVKMLDYVLIFNYDENQEDILTDFANTYRAKNVIIFGEISNAQYLGLANKLYSSSIIVEHNEILFEINSEFFIKVYKSNDRVVAIEYSTNSFKFLQILSALKAEQITEMFGYNSFDIVFASNLLDRYSDINAQSYICQNSYASFENIEVIENDEIWSKAF